MVCTLPPHANERAETMRLMLASVAALSLLALPAGEVSAKDQKKRASQAKKPATMQEHRPRAEAADAYIVREADKLPFGSAIWWDQMQREGRLGGEVP
jgi:hypothetical protein